MVGDFNDWQPGVHTLARRKDGKRAVTVELPSKSTHSFRYLAAGDYWFNDESAGDQDGPTVACTPDGRHPPAPGAPRSSTPAPGAAAGARCCSAPGTQDTARC